MAIRVRSRVEIDLPDRTAKSNISGVRIRRRPTKMGTLEVPPRNPTQTTIWGAAPQATVKTGFGNGRTRCGRPKAGRKARQIATGAAQLGTSTVKTLLSS